MGRQVRTNFESQILRTIYKLRIYVDNSGFCILISRLIYNQANLNHANQAYKIVNGGHI